MTELQQGVSDMFDKIDRPQRLADEIARSIGDAIDTGKLKSGDRLPTEHELSTRFGVARTVIREAVSLLKYDGIIRSKQGIGAFVSEVGNRSAFRISAACFEKRNQLAELLELRTSVQADASAISAAIRTTDNLAEMMLHIQSMEDSINSEVADPEQRVNSELGFYRVITASSANSQYIEFIGMIETQLMNNLRSVVIKNAVAAEWGNGVLDEHRAVYDAIQDGDVTGARNATRKHFERASKRLTDRADLKDYPALKN